VPADPPLRASDDSGFTLVETIVAIGLISTVMAAVTTFMVESLRATDQQRVKQVAIQLADGAIDLARNIEPTALGAGRVAGLVDTTVSAQIPGLTAHLGDMEQLNVPATGVTAPLPMTPQTVPVNSVTFTKHWFLGRCWQPRKEPGGTCAGPPGASDSLVFYRAVVAVTWRAKPCGSTPCSYITSTLINSLTLDPQFNTNESAQPPLVVNPGALTTDVGIAVNRQMAASGGTKPYTWYSVNLPLGLTMGTDGKITGTPTTSGVYLVTITAKDTNQLLGTADLVWTINPPPQLTPVNRITSVGTLVSVTPALSGGTAPYTWSATGLPTGLSINTNTGEITGTPVVLDAGRTLTVRVTVSDADHLTATTTFTWQIVPALVVTVAPQTTTVGSLVSLATNIATGGSGTYTWSATELPAGLTLNPATGAVTGRPTTVKVYTVVYTVTDEIGSSTSATAVWTVR
jgi:prepilin-type N-terminal cleavage/methylation domain-containing protein